MSRQEEKFLCCSRIFLEHAEKLLSETLSTRLSNVQELEKGLTTVSGCPFAFIRVCLPGNEDELIGKIVMKPCPEGRYDHLKDELGDIAGIWTIGGKLLGFMQRRPK